MAKTTINTSTIIPSEVELAFNQSQELLEEHVLLRPEAELAMLKPKIKNRKIIAYTLWGLSGIASIIIMFVDKSPKWLILIIPVLAHIDKITVNHKRLTSLEDAERSYNNIRMEAIEYHQNEQIPLLGQPKNVQFFLDSEALNMHVIRFVQAGYVRIRRALDNSEVDVLKALAVDSKIRGDLQIRKKYK